MFVYLATTITILFLGVFYEVINQSNALGSKKLPVYFFTTPSFFLLFFVSAFRGDFATDYNNYVYLFNFYNRFSFFDIFNLNFDQEIGYVILSRFIGVFSDNPVYLFAVTSLIILVSFYSQFKKHSSYIWLSVLLFVTIGSFYTSFNIMRQTLAVAIIFSGSTFLYERQFKKYFLVVLIASLFHKTAMIMIIFYYILNLEIRVRNFTLLSLGALVTTLFLNPIFSFFQNFLYTAYDSNSYGVTGLSVTNAIVPVSVLIFSLAFVRYINTERVTHRVWLNAVFFYAFFNILGLQIQMVQRLSQFFAPYALLLVPLIFKKIKRGELKVVSIMFFLALLIIYNYVSLKGSDYDPYYFIWNP